MSLSISLLFVTFFLMLLWARSTFAEEIHYATLKGAHGDDINISYRGPWGEKEFLCNINSAQCADFGASTSQSTSTPTPSLYPKTPPGFAITARSPSGSYALTSLTISGKGITNVYYSLYDTRGGQAVFKALLPFYKFSPRVYFSENEGAIVFVTALGEILRYDIASGALGRTFAAQSKFPFLSISYDGTRVAAYNYIKRAAIVWNPVSGTVLEIPAPLPTHVDFLADGSLVLEDNSDNFNALYRVSPGQIPVKLLGGQYEIIDFIASGNSVYYIANASHPLTWSLYKQNAGGSASEEILRDVSYGTSLKIVGDNLVVSKISGKNSNLVFINLLSNKQTTLEPVLQSPAATGVFRETLVLSKRQAVLLKPRSGVAQNLFIWLHGGPNRQTSVNYHSYLSYAIYDELLERLAEAGNYVLKLDYVGSIGYGKEIEEGLNNNVGRSDVADVVGAVAEFKKTHSVTNVYTIGNSYGGYLALRALGEDPSLIQGAVSVSGVTDWYGLIRRIPSSPFVKYFGDINSVINIGNYLAASIYGKVPALHNQKMLLFYGEDDSEVPTWQSKNLYSFARAFGKNVELISYPGEGHIPQKRATLNDICSRIVRSFDLRGVKCSE